MSVRVDTVAKRLSEEQKVMHAAGQRCVCSERVRWRKLHADSPVIQAYSKTGTP